MRSLLRLLERVLMSEQSEARPVVLPRGQAYRWLCPCGAGGRGYGSNQNDVECNADQHRSRQNHPHPSPYVVNSSGAVVSRSIPNASGSVGRHWGWTD